MASAYVRHLHALYSNANCMSHAPGQCLVLCLNSRLITAGGDCKSGSVSLSFSHIGSSHLPHSVCFLAMKLSLCHFTEASSLQTLDTMLAAQDKLQATREQTKGLQEQLQTTQKQAQIQLTRAASAATLASKRLSVLQQVWPLQAARNFTCALDNFATCSQAKPGTVRLLCIICHGIQCPGQQNCMRYSVQMKTARAMHFSADLFMC